MFIRTKTIQKYGFSHWYKHSHTHTHTHTHLHVLTSKAGTHHSFVFRHSQGAWRGILWWVWSHFPFHTFSLSFTFFDSILFYSITFVHFLFPFIIRFLHLSHTSTLPFQVSSTVYKCRRMTAPAVSCVWRRALTTHSPWSLSRCLAGDLHTHTHTHTSIRRCHASMPTHKHIYFHIQRVMQHNCADVLNSQT